MISIETKDHIKKLAGDYKCWSATITYPEALELCELIEDIEALNAINLDLADENEDLVERIGKLIGYIDFLRNTAQGKKKSLNLLEKVVKGELEEIRAEGENFVKPRTGEWIPVTEGLPEEDGRYLVTVENLTGYDLLDSNVFECEFCYTDWIFKGWKDNKVIAWMPLPESYEGGQKDDKA